MFFLSKSNSNNLEGLSQYFFFFFAHLRDSAKMILACCDLLQETVVQIVGKDYNHP